MQPDSPMSMATLPPSLLLHANDLLRGGPLTTVPSQPGRLLVRLLALVLICGLFYGAVMGSFGGVGGERIRQPFYSAAKVPLLLLVTFGLSLPSFFVINSLLGVREDFSHVLRGLIATQAALTIVLASLAPMTAFWYLCCGDWNAALAFNMLIFSIASFSAQMLLRRWYRPLIAKNPRHRLLLRLWLVVYAFVGIQMGWTLRPFIGNPGSPTRFFREAAFSNAYVEVGGVMKRLIPSR